MSLLLDSRRKVPEHLFNSLIKLLGPLFGFMRKSVGCNTLPNQLFALSVKQVDGQCAHFVRLHGCCCPAAAPSPAGATVVGLPGMFFLSRKVGADHEIRAVADRAQSFDAELRVDRLYDAVFHER